jgi:hypothetical protein
MIDAKSFMEFFERTQNVTFVDSNTGERILGSCSAEKRNCASCKWLIQGDGVHLHDEDTVCGNGESEYATEWVAAEHSCPQWKKGTGGDAQ